MGMHLREEIARARSGDSVCRDRIADRLARGLRPDRDRWNSFDGSDDAASVSGAPVVASSGNGLETLTSGRSSDHLGAKRLDSLLQASDCLDDIPDELPIDFRLKLAGPGQHLASDDRIDAVRTAGLLALLLLDATSRDVIRSHMYEGKSIYAIARDLGEDELEVASRFLRALQAWLQLASGFLDTHALPG